MVVIKIPSFVFIFLFWFLNPTAIILQWSPHSGGSKHLDSVNVYNTHVHTHFLSVLGTMNACTPNLI